MGKDDDERIPDVVDAMDETLRAQHAHDDEDRPPDKRTLASSVEPPAAIKLANVKPGGPSRAPVWIHAREWNRLVPAARCKECGNITWKLSLSGGPQKLYDTKRYGPVHKPGCSRPPGRLDLKEQKL